MDFAATGDTSNTFFCSKGYSKGLDRQIEQIRGEAAALPATPVKGEIVRDIVIGPHSRSGYVIYNFNPCQEGWSKAKFFQDGKQILPLNTVKCFFGIQGDHHLCGLLRCRMRGVQDIKQSAHVIKWLSTWNEARLIWINNHWYYTV